MVSHTGWPHSHWPQLAQDISERMPSHPEEWIEGAVTLATRGLCVSLPSDL
jgi:hypothetical protein